MTRPIPIFRKRNVAVASVVAATTIVLIVANVALGYRNSLLRQAIGTLQDSIQGQETQLLAKNVSDPQAMKIEAFLAEWARRQIDVKSMSEFTTQLADEATAAGLQVVKIAPDKSSTTGWLCCCPFNVEFKGTSRQVLKFLRRWDYLGRAAVIQTIDITRATEDENELQIRIKFTVYGEKSG